MPNGGFVIYDIAIRLVRYLGKSFPLASDLKRPFAIHNKIPRARVGDSMILSHLAVEIRFALYTDIDMRNKGGIKFVLSTYIFSGLERLLSLSPFESSSASNPARCSALSIFSPWSRPVSSSL